MGSTIIPQLLLIMFETVVLDSEVSTAIIISVAQLEIQELPVFTQHFVLMIIFHYWSLFGVVFGFITCIIILIII